eukprot:SM000010S04312  [mRNA]  locus=s10:918577:922143:+ [translate_table: standard]
MEPQESVATAAEDDAPAAAADSSWQEVTNVKRVRRQENRQRRPAAAAGGAAAQPQVAAAASRGSAREPDLSIFSALESEGDERQARYKARAAAAAAAAVNGEYQRDGYDDDDDEEEAIARGDGSEIERPDAGKAKKARRPKISVADCAQAMDTKELTSSLAEYSRQYKTSATVQLMRCADYFDRKFSTVTPSHFSWSRIFKDLTVAKAAEVPLIHIPEAIIAITSEWLLSQPHQELANFTLTLVKALLEDAAAAAPAGKSKLATGNTRARVGVAVLLAIVIRKRPEVLLQEAELLRSNAQFQGPEKLPFMIWVYSQAALGDLVIGMMLWIQNVAPLACGNATSPLSRDLALQLLESVILENTMKARAVLVKGASRKGERVVPPAALNIVMRASFPSPSAKTKASDRFQSVYPLVREIALAGGMTSRATKPVALQLFPLSLVAAAEEPGALVNEACSLIVWSLAHNSDCYKQWEKHHLEHLKASTRVLSHLARSWQDCRNSLVPLKDLKLTLLALRRKHAEALKVAKGDKELEMALATADGFCRSLLKKCSGMPACISATAALVAAAAIGVGCYMLSPDNNPWGWDGYIILSHTHKLLPF